MSRVRSRTGALMHKEFLQILRDPRTFVTALVMPLMMLFTMLPSIILSGFVFPIANMPPWLQPFTYLLPMRYFLTCMKGIMMKGNQIADLSGENLPPRHPERPHLSRRRPPFPRAAGLACGDYRLRRER